MSDTTFDDQFTQSQGTEGALESQESFTNDTQAQNDPVSVEDFLQHGRFLKEIQTNVPGNDGQETTPATDNQDSESPKEAEEGSLEEPLEGSEELGESEDTDDPLDGEEGEADEADEDEEGSESWTLDGEEVSPEQVKEWKLGYMRNADYTQKTQEVAELRKEAEQAIGLWQAFEIDPIGTLDFLRERYEEAGIYEPKDPEVVEKELQIRQMEQQRQADQEYRQHIDNQVAQAQFEEYMQHLEAKYDGQGFDRNEVIQFAVNNNINDPELAFKTLAYEKLQAKHAEEKEKAEKDFKAKEEEIKKQAIKEYLDKKSQKSTETPLPVGSGGGGGSSPITTEEIKTFRDARKASLAFLEGREH